MIHLETRIAAPREACFALSLSVDAHTSSMGSSRERAIAGVTAGQMRQGDTVTWRATHFGVPWRLTSLISEYEAPHRFVDEQVSGPFEHWRHEHLFEERGSGTVMRDIIDFAAPWGPLGRLADRLVLDRYMRSLIVERNAWLKTELERTTPPGPPRNRGAAS